MCFSEVVARLRLRLTIYNGGIQLVQLVGGGRDSCAATCGLINTVNTRIERA